MPHIQIQYTDNLSIDPQSIFTRIASVIEGHDPGAGRCKAMGFPVSIYNIAHMNVTIHLLAKAHRDDEFTRKLLADVDQEIRSLVHEPCGLSIQLEYRGAYYMTGDHPGVPIG